MSLKDGAGLVKKYAMLDIQRYQNVAVGDTVTDCQKSYKALLSTNGIVNTSTGAGGVQEATGIIRTLTQAVVDGNSHFYLTLEGDTHIFDCPVTVIEIVAYRVGDTVTLQYFESTPTCTVTGIGAAEQPAAEPAEEAAAGDAAAQAADAGAQADGAAAATAAPAAAGAAQSGDAATQQQQAAAA